MTGTEIALVQNKGSLAVRADQGDWTDEQKAALAQIGVADAPRGDQLVFLHVSQKMGLDPFNKEIYMIGRWDSELGRKKWTIQVGIDGFRSKSEEHEQYAGIEGPEWCGTDGVWRDVWLSEEPPAAARFTVYRKDWPRPAHAVAHYREYVQTKKDGKPTAMWAGKPAGQLGKCAEALARRKAFPRKLTGVYLEEEMAHLNNPHPAMVIDSQRDEQPSEPDWDTLVTDAETRDDLAELKKIWDLARGLRPNDAALLDRVAAAGARVKAKLAEQAEPKVNVCVVDETVGGDPDPAPAAPSQRNKLFALLRDGGVEGSQRVLRLRIASRILNRPPAVPVTSFDQLTTAEADQINEFLQRHKDGGDLTHTLADLGAVNGTAHQPTGEETRDQP